MGRYMDRNDTREWHDTILVRRNNLQAPNIRRKDVTASDALLVLQTFNIKYGTGIFFWERHRTQLAGCYLGLALTGARAPEFVDGKKRTAKTASRGRPKALCYENILLIVVRHPETGQDVLAISIKFIYHKGADNKPKPTIFFFTSTRWLIFCFISVTVSLAVHDGAFDSSNLTSARAAFQSSETTWGDNRSTLEVRSRLNQRPIATSLMLSAIKFYLQNAFLNKPTEDSLLGILSYIGLMRNLRTNKDMVPDKVWEIMRPDPEIKALKAERAQFKGGRYLIKAVQPGTLKIGRRGKGKSLELRIQAAELMIALYNKRKTKKRDRIRRRPPAEAALDVMVEAATMSVATGEGGHRLFAD
ncbi:hypothetical protein DL767_008966 [Monosporascus sp. MG133]|nr:hypothetical protein DL767_008966 [Monosporascus sp. MG133]